MIVDLFLVYQFIKRLATPFDEWKAYDLGIIDDRGEILLKRRNMTREQRDNWDKFDVLVLKLKRLLEKIPGGRSRLASYAAALWLIKEGEDRDANMLTEETLEDELSRYIQQVRESFDFDELNEVFDKPYPYDLDIRDVTARAFITLPDRTRMMVSFMKKPGGVWDVIFERNGSMDVTGKGDQYKVFSTVIAVIQEFVEKVQPEKITFGADKTNSDSRSNLYDRMIRRFAKRAGYNFTSQEVSGSTYFTLMKEEAPTVNVGSGNIAGVGVGPDGEPGVSPSAMKRYKKRNKKKLKKFVDMMDNKKE